jgi:hypothetical protein
MTKPGYKFIHVQQDGTKVSLIAEDQVTYKGLVLLFTQFSLAVGFTETVINRYISEEGDL